MQEEEKIDSEYLRGFNEGYIIAKHLPELADQLAQIKNDTPRINGFHDGRIQHAVELAPNKNIDITKSNTTKSPDPQKFPDKGRNKDVDR